MLERFNFNGILILRYWFTLLQETTWILTGKPETEFFDDSFAWRIKNGMRCSDF